MQRWQDPFATTEAGKKNSSYVGICGFALLGLFSAKVLQIFKNKDLKYIDSESPLGVSWES